MFARRHYSLPLPGRAPLVLGARTLVMGIINVTPDSFADGGVRFDAQRAVDDGLQMIEDGADLLDVGGESTRPGAEPLPAAEELRRVLPVVERLAADLRVPVSIDTYKAVVAKEAVARGAAIVNDVSGLQFDPALAQVVAETKAAVVLMHNRGRSREMYREAVYADVAAEIVAELEQAMSRATAAGVARDVIILDPGLGFAKRAAHSYEALAHLDALAVLDRPILCGPSRKSFLKDAIGDRTGGREWGTAAASSPACSSARTSCASMASRDDRRRRVADRSPALAEAPVRSFPCATIYELGAHPRISAASIMARVALEPRRERTSRAPHKEVPMGHMDHDRPDDSNAPRHTPDRSARTSADGQRSRARQGRRRDHRRRKLEEGRAGKRRR